MFINSNKATFPQNIVKKSFNKHYSVNGQTVSVTIKDALYAEMDQKDIMLDETSIEATIIGIINAMRSNSTKYNPIPKSIIIAHSIEQIDSNATEITESSKDSLFTSYEPKWNFDDVYIDDNQIAQILSAVAMVKHREKLFDEWGLEQTLKMGRSMILNFYGPPGTGKSMMAEAVAQYLGKKVCLVNYAQLESKFVGETPKNISRVFDNAKEEDAVLIFDEADSFLGKRLTNISQSADYGVNITRSVMLIELEKFDGIVIFTTNLISNYDDAFKRRILANVEFKLPDEAGRSKIWSKHIPDKLPLYDISVEQLASRYSNITGADIKDILLMASVLGIQNNRDFVTLADFDQANKFITSRYLESETNIIVKHETITEEQYQKEIAASLEDE